MYTQQAAASQAEILTMSYGNTGWMLKFLKVKQILQPTAVEDNSYRSDEGASCQTDGIYEWLYMKNSYNWWASVGGSSCSTHLWWNETRVDARAGQGSVHLVMAHHGKRGGIRARNGQRCTQGRGRWRREKTYFNWFIETLQKRETIVKLTFQNTKWHALY